ncbi:MAG: hypothetical protein ACLPID_10670 [Beijerinckiaceae bacterium]
MAIFSVSERSDGTAEFHANIDLAPLKLPKESEVVVEAYRQNLHERFPFGTVAATAPARATVLRELGAVGLNFRIKVVESQSGRLLARGDKLGAAEHGESGRRALLRVIARDLGQEPWKTVLHEDGRPVLILNDHIPGALAKLDTDPVFRSLILPGALRQVLLMMCIVKVEDNADDDDEEADDHWATEWIRFAEKISGVDKPDWGDLAEVHRWVDRVCGAFSARFSLMAIFEAES